MLFGAFKKSFAVSLAVASLTANAWNDNGEWPFAKMGCGYVSRHISFVEKQMKRLRVFVTAYGVGQREVVELKERFDFEPVLLPVLDRENFSVWYPKREPPYAESMSETEYAQELEKRLSQLSDCEAILIGRSYPASIPGEVLQRLLNRVSDGAGLVWIAPWDGFEEIPGVELSEQLDANFFPTELIPALRGTRIWSGKYGKGSVMEVVYPMPVNEFKGANGVVADRQMYLETLTPYESDDPLYYDFCHAFLGKCLWQVVGWNPELPKREEVIAYNSLGEAVPTGSRSAQLELIRYLNSEGLTVDYSVQMCEKSTKVGIRLEKDAIKPGEHIRGEIVGTTGCKEIVISLVDDAQRVIWRQVFSDVEEIPLDISLEHQQSKYALFRVDADDDLAWTNVYFNTVDEDREDFTFTIWSNHGSSSRVSRLGLDQLRQAGVDNVMECTWGCVSQNLMRRIPRRIKEAGINYSPYATFIRGPTAEVAQGSDCVMMDAWPEYCRTGAFRVEDGGRNHNSTRVMDIAEASRDIGAFFYSLGDENSLSKDETDENCFCDKCQERFRNYLKRTYGTMSALNAEYGSQYLNWSEIHPLRLEEARSRGLIPLWMDFRDFMEGQWVNLHRYVAAQVQSMDSNAVLGIEGMAPPEKWYTGWNFYRLLPYFRFAAPYFKGRDVRALQYLGNKSVRGAWYGSYEGQMSESSMRRTPWLYLFAGLNGTFWWTANFTQKGCSFSNCNVFRPDLTMLDHFSQSAKEVRFIKESGIGKLMAGARPFPTGVRVHYSNPCLRMSAACPESVSWAESMENFESVLEEGAIAYSYLSPQELESAVLDDIKVLVLPQSRAMSDAECDAVVRFVRKGGLLIADSIPAAYDEHGRLREVNPLFELFVTNSIAPHKVGDGYTVLTLDAFQNAAISAKEGLSGAMITNMWELLALVGVEPFVKVLDGVHNIVRADVFENNGVVLVGMIGPSLPLSAESVESLRTVNLRNDMWAYDLGKDGKCLGRGKSFAIELDPLIGRVLAFSAEEIQPKGVKVDRKWIRPGERLCATIRESCGVHLISVEDSRGEVVFRDRVSGAKVSYVPTWNDKEGKYVMRIKSVVGGHEQLVEFFVSNSPNGIRATWDANAKPMHSEVKTVLTWTQNGNLTVDKGGICEVLLVGGGGGGGAYANDNQGGAGGGAGGVIYRNSFLLEPGTYEINVGNGGEIGKNGGDTQAFGLTAYGGGGGSSGVSPWGGMNGGSGGGAAFGAGSAAGGKAVYGVAGNLGHDGGGSVHIYGAGGGGGAGGPGVTPTGSEAGNGGHGFSCSISGNSVFYAGGGGAYRVSTPTQGGIGGGGAGGVSGSPGTGGGGGGNAAGGSGIVIISFMRDGDYMSDDFNLKGGDDVFPAVDDTVVVFRKDGKLRIDGSGSVELLMVGGGGGGGSGDDVLGGAGGGAGGFVHFENFPVTSGVYDVKIGLGGLVNSNGGDTALSGLGFVAYGGGAGSAGQSVWGGRNGASGGGGATAGGVGGRAIFLDECNIGNDGGAASNVYGPGGGGGAGACGESTGTSSPGRGGAGLPCTITGKLQYYAGGGSGYRKSIPIAGSRGGGGSGGGAGQDGTGGGGGGCAVGGSGILILRYHRQNYRANIEGAAGGEVVEMNGFRMHTFAKDEQFSIPYDGAIEVLLVGGGGGGGVSHPEDANRGGGGGGAGGVVHRHMILQKGKYDVQIGAGGAIGTNGQDTVAFGLVALGGGHGGWYDGVKPPGDGGSGGGAAVFSGMASGGLAIGAVKNNLGNEGGGSIHIYGAGGGGGAGSGGKTSTGSQPGEGGIGYQCEISGTSVYYAGGGAGFRQGVVTSGGLGGGGAGGSAGEPGTGGGGGGGASGGNGIVIVRYRVVDPSGLIITVK